MNHIHFSAFGGELISGGGGGGYVFFFLQVDGPMTEEFKSGQKSVRLRYPSRLTFIGFEVLQQTDLSEMLRC